MPEWLPDWLFEGRLTVYAVLAVSLVVVLVIWKRTPRKAYLFASLALAALIGLYFLMDLLVKTDREQITNAFQEMSAGVEAHDVDRIFKQVSETYNRHNSNKAAFRGASTGVIEGHQVDKITVWAFEFAPDYKQKDSPSAERSNVAKVGFMVRADTPNGQMPYRVEAVMHRDTDGQWRMQSWEVFTFPNGDTPQRVPGLD
jgi:hypothetical protein